MSSSPPGASCFAFWWIARSMAAGCAPGMRICLGSLVLLDSPQDLELDGPWIAGPPHFRSVRALCMVHRRSHAASGHSAAIYRAANSGRSLVPFGLAAGVALVEVMTQVKLTAPFICGPYPHGLRGTSTRPGATPRQRSRSRIGAPQTSRQTLAVRPCPTPSFLLRAGKCLVTSPFRPFPIPVPGVVVLSRRGRHEPGPSQSGRLAAGQAFWPWPSTSTTWAECSAACAPSPRPHSPHRADIRRRGSLPLLARRSTWLYGPHWRHWLLHGGGFALMMVSGEASRPPASTTRQDAPQRDEFLNAACPVIGSYGGKSRWEQARPMSWSRALERALVLTT